MPEAVQELLNISLKVLYFRLFERNSCDIVSCSLLSQFPTLRYDQYKLARRSPDFPPYNKASRD